MNEPIVFISRFRIKDSLLDDFKKHYQASIPRTEAEKPGTLVQLAYFDDGAEELVIVRVLSGAQAMDRQLQGADERSKAAFQYLEPTRIEIYGRPNDFALEMMKKVSGTGIAVSISSNYLGGFIRS